MNINNFEFKFLTAIDQVKGSQWNAVIDQDSPFSSYQFLSALESSDCVSAETGWQPHHLVVLKENCLIAAMPLYLKSHSYGEYVFDFQWANAYHQAGLNYYPKLVNTIPYTPCCGARIFTKIDPAGNIISAMQKAVSEKAKSMGISSWHSLFPNKDFIDSGLGQSLLKRVGAQYHWFNQQYGSFGDFLDRCKMKSRKNIKRERRLVIEAGIQLRAVEGENISQQLWQDFYYFYHGTYLKRSGNTGYLNQRFFDTIASKMPNKIMMVVAELNNKTIAIALYFKGKDSLFGRYWGASADYQYLHFEACYYQGIEYCIRHKIAHFDVGAQGEHKIQRGFEPIETYSMHWINEANFERAIGEFIQQEAQQVKNSIKILSNKLPFKQSSY